MAIAVRCQSCGHQFRSSDAHRGKTAACTHCQAELHIDGKRVPDFDVFVSHSSKDKLIADAVVATIEADKLRCWVAPRDIAPGVEWSSSIIDAIGNSRIMVLIYSAHANASPQVLREVERAVSKGLAVTPLRIEDVPMSKGMEYFISTSHWLDALTPPLETHMARLVRTVRGLIEQDYEEPPPPGALGFFKSTKPASAPPTRRKSSKMLYVLAIVALLTVIVVMAANYGPWRARIAGNLASRSPPVAAPDNSPAADLAALKAMLDHAWHGGGSVPLALGEPVRSDTPFKANEKGYYLTGTLQIGNSSENGHTGAIFRGEAMVQPGFCLEGGKLLVCNGELDLHGTEQMPCVLINVLIGCEDKGTVRATHTICKDCTFGKSGNWYLFGGYTSKWIFDDCILSKSNFEKLDRITYGLKLRRCSFIDCMLPQRHWGYAKTEGPDDDAAALARGEWSNIEKCDFYGSEIPPSVFWCTNKCNAYDCRVKAGGEPEVFQSRTNLGIVIGLVPGSDAMISELRANTSTNGTGKVTYAAGPYLSRK